MKNFKLILLLFAVALFSLPAMAQDAKTEVKETVTEKAPKKLSARKMAKQTASAVTELTEKQQKMILNYSRNLAKVDVKKEMKKTLKKMSAEDRQKVLGYITKVKASGNKPMANVKDVKPAAPTALKANDKTNKAKSKVDKSKQPKYVMKEFWIRLLTLVPFSKEKKLLLFTE
jgi:hypothetical protein